MLITYLMIKHVIADYFMQYSWMIKDKGTYGAWGGLAHSGWHGILTGAVIVWFGHPLLGNSKTANIFVLVLKDVK